MGFGITVKGGVPIQSPSIPPISNGRFGARTKPDGVGYITTKPPRPMLCAKNGVGYISFCRRPEDPVDDPVVEDETARSLRTARYAQNYCRPPRPYSGHGFRGPDSLSRLTFRPRPHEEPHCRSSAGSHLLSNLLR